MRSVELDAKRYLTGLSPASQAIPFRAESIPPGVAAINAPAVWSLTQGEGIRVGIMDTGIDPAHADLIANYKGGYDFVRNDTDPDDESPVQPMHGTTMAGVIAAAANGTGVIGVAPRAEIYALKIFGSSSTESSTIIAALDWAIANGIDVLNCSFGGEGRLQLEEEAYRRAKEAGIVVVASSGNNAQERVNCPACYDDLVLAVGAIDREGALAPFSNWGLQSDFVAPGVDVLSTAATGGAVTGGLLVDGTSLFGSWITGPSGAEVSGVLSEGFVSGAIGIIPRGVTRTDNELLVLDARNAGAAGIVFVNDGNGACVMTLTRNRSNPPAICVSRDEGAMLRARAGQTATLGIYADDYRVASGTSMAAPHVAGAAALLLALRR
ncbi:MAG TPA: S8 family serine peptidase, partial [Thermoanaerobaculia bacterium]|nr:S8 family serine peptidase [Thermoanaerobaculia bacterium]